MSLRSVLEQTGGRRFILAMLTCLTTAALQYLGKLDTAGTTYGMVTGALVWGYIAGNTVQKVKGPTNE